MSNDDRQFIKNVQKAVVITGIGVAITMLSTGLAFYYTTKEKIKNLETEMNKKANKELVQMQYESIIRELQSFK